MAAHYDCALRERVAGLQRCSLQQSVQLKRPFACQKIGGSGEEQDSVGVISKSDNFCYD